LATRHDSVIHIFVVRKVLEVRKVIRHWSQNVERERIRREWKRNGAYCI